MSLIQTPWTSQPQQVTGVRRDAFPGRPLVYASRVSDGCFDQVGNRPPVAVSASRPTISVSSAGVAGEFVPANSQYYSITTATNLVSGYPLTVACWARIDSTYSGVIYSLNGTGYNAILGFAGYKALINTGSTTGNTGFDAPTSMQGLRHIVCVHRSGSFDCYIDGVKQSKIVVGDFWGHPTAGNHSIGNRLNGASPQYFDGAIQDLYVFQGELTESEAKSLYRNHWQVFQPVPRRIFAPVVAGDPTLYPSLYTNDNSFYAPAISVGDVTLVPSLFSNSNTFHAATVTLGGSTQTLTPSLYSNASAFYGPSVTTGAVTLTPSLVTNTNAFYGPSVSPGAVTLTPTLFSNTNSFFGAVVTLDTDKILYPSLVSNSNSFYGPTVSVGAVSLLPSLFVNSNTFYNHVVGGALTDSEKIDLILDILSNRQTLDATTGIYTLYADDGVTVLKTAQAWEDSEGTQPYRGRGLKRLDALQ